MKKRLAIFALAFTSLTTFAWEANVKTGFDFFRHHQKAADFSKEKSAMDGRGFTLGGEIIPFNKGIFELGAGFEYNFGVKEPVYQTFASKDPDAAAPADPEPYVSKKFMPIYLVSHLNMYRNSDNSGSIYLVNRLGGVVYKKSDEEKIKGGLYYGAGLGADFGPLTAEVLYDGAWIPANKSDVRNSDKKDFYDNQMQNKVGVRIGLRLGDYKTEAPVVEPEIVKPEVEPVIITQPVVKEIIVEKPVVTEVVKEVVVEKPVIVKKTKEEIAEIEKKEFIHGNCSTETKVCTIFGFKVDGRIPNEEEKQALSEIVDVVNDFAKSGKMEIVGNTDSTGSIAYNQKLSVQRAENVAKILKEFGLKETIEITNIRGEGELKPIDTNKTKLGRYHNRRVELIFSDLEQ